MQEKKENMPKKDMSKKDMSKKDKLKEDAPEKGASQKAEPRKNALEGNYSVDGLLFEYTLNWQKSGFYLLKGTLSLRDPYDPHEPMKIYDKRTGKSACASVQLHIRTPKEGEELNVLIDIEIKKNAQKLMHMYREQYNQQQKEGKALNEMTFYEAELAFLKDASRAVSESSSVRNRFCSSIRKFSKSLQNVKIGKVKKSDLKKVGASCEDGGARIFKDLKKFIKYIENQQVISSGFLPLIEDVIKSLPTPDDPQKGDRARKNASNSNVLSYEAEEVFNQCLLSNAWDPKFVCLGLIKGSGLNLTEACELKVDQVQRYQKDKEIVFLKIKRSYAGSATQDYTFPIFPFEAVLLNDYINALAKKEGKERLAEGKYLFSSDGGKTAIKSSVITETCRIELSRLKFGYADLIGRVDLQKNKGVEYLKRTYLHRLEKWAGLVEKDDEGAYMFMAHLSLSNKVQADHYRGLTGESGREFLVNIVLHDRRFLPKEKTLAVSPGRKNNRNRSDKKYRTIGNRKNFVFYKKDDMNVQQANFTIILNPGDVIECAADHGCVVSVEDVIYLDGRSEENAPTS